jgi:hypothetical protein
LIAWFVIVLFSLVFLPFFCPILAGLAQAAQPQTVKLMRQEPLQFQTCLKVMRFVKMRLPSKKHMRAD